MRTVTFNGQLEDLFAFLENLPGILSGRAPDRHGLCSRFSIRLGNNFLSSIQNAFRIKSGGGTGDDGIRWPPLALSTIRRRLKAMKGQRLQKPVRTTKAYHAAVARYLKAGRGRTESLMLARRAVYAPAGIVPMLHDRGDLYRSLTPGVDATMSGAGGQVFETGPGRLAVGTAEKPWHHTTSGKGRLPCRAFWPKTGGPPDVWWQRGLDAAGGGLARDLAGLMDSGRI